MVYFIIYEWFKKTISIKRGDRAISLAMFANYIVAAGTSKAVASIMTYPYEVIYMTYSFIFVIAIIALNFSASFIIEL